jgi:hypothetical protein
MTAAERRAAERAAIARSREAVAKMPFVETILRWVPDWRAGFGDGRTAALATIDRVLALEYPENEGKGDG